MGSGPQLIHRGTPRTDDKPTWHHRPSQTGCNSLETQCHPHDWQNDEHPLNPLTAVRSDHASPIDTRSTPAT